MDELIPTESTPESNPVPSGSDLVTITESILLDTKADISGTSTLSVPIAELSALGAGVSSMLPSLNTITQTSTINMQGLYRVANAQAGDVLKAAKNGNFWSAMRSAGGKSKMAQLQAVDGVTQTTRTIMPLNPATMMMAVTLFSIEKQLDSIEQTQEQILSFLEAEKQSEVEANVQTLISILRKYKSNWDNEHFVNGNHELVLGIQLTARKNMLVYQRKVQEQLSAKQLFVVQRNVDAKYRDLLRDFKYYRLSLYTYALSSLLEIMLSGNFKESYIAGIQDEIRSFSNTYHESFDKCSLYLEKMSDAAIDIHLMKGVGVAGNNVGKFIGRIPVVKEGPVDELLQRGGENLQVNAQKAEQRSVKEFAAVGNPGTGFFTDQMDRMIQIYNHTSDILFDDKNIYLVSE